MKLNDGVIAAGDWGAGEGDAPKLKSSFGAVEVVLVPKREVEEEVAGAPNGEAGASFFSVDGAAPKTKLGADDVAPKGEGAADEFALKLKLGLGTGAAAGVGAGLIAGSSSSSIPLSPASSTTDDALAASPKAGAGVGSFLSSAALGVAGVDVKLNAGAGELAAPVEEAAPNEKEGVGAGLSAVLAAVEEEKENGEAAEAVESAAGLAVKPKTGAATGVSFFYCRE